MTQLDFAKRMTPPGYQIVSEAAIRWLYEHHRDVYEGFYGRVAPEPTAAKAEGESEENDATP